MNDKTPDPCGSDSSTELGADSIVWVRHNGRPHTSGVAHFGGECPPGWVGGARPFFSADYLAEAVNRERERCAKLVDDACAYTGGHGEPGTHSGYELAKLIRKKPNHEITGPKGSGA